ncbi:putative ATP-dependent RNA helicase TDRD12 [Nilaparvata lugens]|uniref:putative ATP-dependent RNA helicase TDRD12 n=1 Tax=Nilaparvata lugens TaxID=108931 RepID=UPI00193D3626|nr:putative ATP-dependent RNA helicase TDRD12 [Nilaparvata lugens]
MESWTQKELEPNPDWRRIVVKNVSDSGSIWVATYPVASMCYDKSELQPLSSDEIEIKEGEMFAVKGEYGDHWYRGKVISINEVNIKLFLIDSAETCWALKKNLRLLPEYSKKILPQIFQVNFYGIQPVITELGICENSLQPKRVKVFSWTNAAIRLIRKRLDASRVIYFKEIDTVSVGEFDNTKIIKYGSIFIECMKEFVCLNDILCAEGFATKVESFRGIAKELTKQLTDQARTTAGQDTGNETIPRTVHPFNRSEKRKDTIIVEKSVAAVSESNKTLFRNVVGFGSYMLRPISYPISSLLGRFPVLRNSVSDKNHEEEAIEERRCSSSIKERPSSSKSLVSDSTPMQEHAPAAAAAAAADAVDESSSSNSEMNIEPTRLQLIKKEKKRNNMFSLFNIVLHSSPDIEETIEPINFLFDSYICERIQSVLTEKRRYDLTPLQKHIYPVLCKRYNILVVGNATSGKTLASVVSIVSLLRQEQFYSSLPMTHGPKAIHLCSYSYKVRNTARMYTDLINGPDVVVQVACGGAGLDSSVKLNMIKRCDILVTTPICLARVLKAGQIVDLKRLCHIIYDDADTIFDIFLDEIKSITAAIKILENKRTSFKVQKIVLSQTWFPKLRDFVKNVIFSGFICVSNFNQLESVLYSNFKPNFQFLQPKNKADRLKLLLQSHPLPARRIVIICNDVDEVTELEQKLEEIGKTVLVAHEGMTHIEVSGVRKCWTSSMALLDPVLVCTDSANSIFSELEITDCTWLIQYSLPPSKTVFSNRFGCLLDSFRNIFLDNEDKLEPRIDIFIDESNDEQFPMIVNVMKRMKVLVHPVIDEVVERIKKRKELAKKHSPVCDQLREFGVCHDRKVCHFRHIFIKNVDDEENLYVPKVGLVKLNILDVHSANHLSAQTLEYKVDSQWRRMPNHKLLELICLKMDAHFKVRSQIFIYPKPELGDLVAVKPDHDLYCRGKVITILKRNEEKEPTKVRVKLIDLGAIMEFSTLKLYDLPDELKKYPGQAVDVFLCGLKPADQDCAWDLEAVNFVKRWVESAQRNIRVNGKSQYIYGQISMSAGHTLWLEHITHCEWLEATKTQIHSNLGFELLQAKLALSNPDHKPIIRNLCAQANLNIFINETKQEKTSTKKKVNNIERWAHLPRDEFSSVEVIMAQRPDCIFIRHEKFKDRIDLLTKDLADLVPKRLHEGDLVEGDICLAFYDEDESWNRAKVLEFKSATQVKIFFVDHGDFKVVGWNYLAKIPENFITRLPFQAMECELVGVRASNEDINFDEAIYELTECDELCKPLQAYVFDLELEATITGGRKYSIVLIDTTSNPFVVINEELCRRGFADWHLDDEQKFDDIVSRCKVSESEEDFLDDPESYGFIDFNDNVELPELKPDKEECLNSQTWTDVRFDGEKLVPVVEPELAAPGPFQKLLDNFEENEEDLFYLLGLNKKQVLKALLPSLEYEALDTPKITEIPPSMESKPVDDYPRITEIQNTSDVDGDVSDAEDKCSAQTKIKSKRKHKKQNSEKGNDSDDDDDDVPPPLGHSGDVYTPKVTWFDDDCHVWVYIHLIGVQDYRIVLSKRTLSVR